MLDFQIRLTEMPVGITAEYNETELACKGYFCEGEKEAFHVSATEEDINKEKEYFLERNGRAKISLWQLERSALYRLIAEEMIDYDRVLIHGSALAIDGNGYLFIAPSGTGKSTHTALWRKVFGERIVMVNDDKPLVRMDQDEILIYGTPWDGKHRLSNNIGVPLKGIARVYRSEENRVERLSKEEAMTRLLEQTYRSEKPLRVVKTLEMLKRISDEIPFYALYCNMEEEAAYTAYEAMTKGETR